MTFWAAGAAVVAGAVKTYGAQQGMKAQKKAGKQGIAEHEKAYEDQKALQSPYLDAGTTSQNRLMDYMGLGKDPNAPDFGKYARDFGASDFQADPGYQFRLKEGLKELDRKAAMHGGSLGGNALRAGQEYGQNMASQEYQNAFNRYQTNRTNQLDPLSFMIGGGRNAANVLASDAGMRGQLNAESYAGIGNARASGYKNMAGAQADAIKSFGQGMSMGKG